MRHQEQLTLVPSEPAIRWSTMAARARQARRPRSRTSLKAGFTLGLTGSSDDKSLQGYLQFGFSENTTDSSSILIQKAETFDIKIPGPATDEIDHNHDVFVLLLNPLLTVAQNSPGTKCRSPWASMDRP